MSELAEKVKASIERIKAFCPPEGYYLAFSGGKDSVVCKALLDMAGVKYDAHYRVTSVDPPELVNFIRRKFPEVHRDKPRYPDDYRVEELRGKQITMWNLIPGKMLPPSRKRRYCCGYLKESGGDGRMVVTGVRWEESASRKMNSGLVKIASRKPGKELSASDFFYNKSGGVVLTNDNAATRRVMEQCYKRHKTTVNPIIDWTDKDVWELVKTENIPYCELYDEGFTRLGCIGCPMAGQHGREMEFWRWPEYAKLYLLAFDKMLKERHRRGRMGGTWSIDTTPQDVFRWWMEYDILPGQMDLFDDLEDEEE